MDRTGLPKLHLKKREGFWLCEADGFIGIGDTPEHAHHDWYLELIDSFDARSK